MQSLVLSMQNLISNEEGEHRSGVELAMGHRPWFVFYYAQHQKLLAMGYLEGGIGT